MDYGLKKLIIEEIKNDKNLPTNNIKETTPKNTIDPTADFYKNDYQFARAYDLITGLILINKKQ